MKRKMVTDSPVVSSDFSDSDDEEGKESEEVLSPSRRSGEVRAPAVADYSSICKSSQAKKYASKYKVAPEYELHAPTAEQRAHAPPPGFAAIHMHHLQFGLRLPLHPFIVSLLDYYRIALAQLNPVCIFPILGFLEICKSISVAPTLGIFRHFFRFRSCSRKYQGWYTFCQNPPKLVYGYPTTASNWKKSFFFFKTTVDLPWNHSRIQDPPLADSERPSDELLRKFLANVMHYYRHELAQSVESEEDKGMAELDVPSAAVRKSSRLKEKGTAQRKWAKNYLALTKFPSAVWKSSSVTEKGAVQRKRAKYLALPELMSAVERMDDSIAAEPANTLSLEEPANTLSLEEPANTLIPVEPANTLIPTEPANTLRKCGYGSSQVPSVPSLEKCACDIQKRECSFNLQLRGEKEELEKVVATLKLDLMNRFNMIALLQGEKEELHRVVKDKDSTIATLLGDKEVLEKVVEDIERCVKDKNRDITLLQGDKEDLKKAVVAIECDVKVKDNEICVLKSENAIMKDEIALLKAENSRIKNEVSLVKSEVSSLKTVSDNEIAHLKAEKSASDDEIGLLKAEISKLESASNDENSLLNSENLRLKSVVEDRGPLLRVYTWKLFKTRAFASFLYKLSFLAQKLGKHDAAKLIRDRYPAITEEALAGLEDPRAAYNLDTQFFNMIQDDAVEFPLLSHLLSLAEIPSSTLLVDLDEDEDPDAFIYPSLPRAN